MTSELPLLATTQPVKNAIAGPAIRPNYPPAREQSATGAKTTIFRPPVKNTLFGEEAFPTTAATLFTQASTAAPFLPQTTVPSFRVPRLPTPAALLPHQTLPNIHPKTSSFLTRKDPSLSVTPEVATKMGAVTTPVIPAVVIGQAEGGSLKNGENAGGSSPNLEPVQVEFDLGRGEFKRMI